MCERVKYFKNQIIENTNIYPITLGGKNLCLIEEIAEENINRFDCKN